MADADDPHAPQEEAPYSGRRARRILRLAATGLVLVVALAAAAVVWRFYVAAPWTRDGRVRVQVAGVAPQVSGQIVDLKVADNQAVKRGDVLYVIEAFDFEVAVTQAEAEVKNREADLQVKNAQSVRRQELSTVSTSVEEKQQFAGTAKIAEAALETAKAQLAQARVNLQRTTVRAPVNGRVTNLLLRVGDYASQGSVNVRVIDTDSFWIDGYFEETKMAAIHVGDPAEMALMGYDAPLRGTVESITLGIATANAAPSTQGLPNVDPVYTWVRLAQRVPVRIRIDHVPDGVPLVAGMTATVVVNRGTGADPGWFADLRRTVTGAP
ncbi:efflux RND transporter periplasmic adaptor subunit [Methylobacterium dankookense]|uniref:p-hydroxybenzoic acid efflux pump subunit AaeA n=1 Tax=Methylobacterium dankookense TaxID=560405 RepID=A0A564G321_9HYPH|nr:efflux RND transporter periplasmic adaptor subunit [Methylobacterium dankookense]GJD56908.1 p-hydroxybenzoic acid efflux pump subunit AaeA [Methylobacterium dankookense]VUF14875.1 p-hydroxybenzoic acid efflux pump subunit AaeA [Methylobacterium dankookense]